MQRKNRNLRFRRRGLSTLEVVLTTGIVFPGLVMMAYVGVRALRALFTLVGTMVGSPLL